MKLNGGIIVCGVMFGEVGLLDEEAAWALSSSKFVGFVVLTKECDGVDFGLTFCFGVTFGLDLIGGRVFSSIEIGNTINL